MLDGNELKFGDLLVEKGNECDSLFIFLTYIASRSNIKLLKIPCDVYIPSVPVWKPDYESFLDSRYVRDRGFYRPILNMNYADPDVIKVHNDKANPYLNLGKWLYNCSLYPIKIVGGRHCGKTLLAKELARQLLNSTYGLASADNWAQRYLYTVDKLYDTLGIKDYLNKVYGDPMLKFKNGNYIRWDIDLANYDDDKLKESFKAPDIVDLVNQIIRKEEESMMENRNKLGEWTFRGDTFTTGHTAVFGAVIPTTVYASKSALRFAFHPVENSSYVVDVVCKDCDFGNRGDLRDGFFVKVYTDTRHKLALHDNYPNNLALKNIGDAYKKLLREEDEPMRNLQYFNRRFIKNVIFHDPATIVEWKDGTKTVVKIQDGEHYDPEKGLAMAIAKKAMGNKRDYYHVFKHYLKKVKTESVYRGYFVGEACENTKALIVPEEIADDVMQYIADTFCEKASKVNKGLKETIKSMPDELYYDNQAIDLKDFKEDVENDLVTFKCSKADAERIRGFIVRPDESSNDVRIIPETIEEVKRYEESEKISDVDAEGPLMPL